MRINILEKAQSSDTANQQDASRSFGIVVQQEEQTLHRLRDDLEEVGRWKRRIPFIALFGLTITPPCFMASNGFGCAVLGGEWLRGLESGEAAYVFYAE